MCTAATFYPLLQGRKRPGLLAVTKAPELGGRMVAEPGFTIPEALLYFTADSCGSTHGPSSFLVRSPAAAPERS